MYVVLNTDLMFSSATDQWSTPQDFFDKLDSEFHFTLDVAADATNHKCERFFDKTVDGLSQPWHVSERERERERAMKSFGVIPHMAEKSVNG